MPQGVLMATGNLPAQKTYPVFCKFSNSVWNPLPFKRYFLDYAFLSINSQVSDFKNVFSNACLKEHCTSYNTSIAPSELFAPSAVLCPRRDLK